MRYGAQWHNFYPGPEHMIRFPIALIRETVGLLVMRTEDFHCQVPSASCSRYKSLLVGQGNGMATLRILGAYQGSLQLLIRLSSRQGSDS